MPRSELRQTRTLIEEFLASSRRPALIEEGEEPIALSDESCAIDQRQGRLTIEAWDQTRNVARRVVGVDAQGPGRLELRIERFGKRRGRLILFDQARPGNEGTERRGSRVVAREEFRRSVRRQFPGWKLAALSADPHLEHSLSPAYPRALVTRASQAWAAIAAPDDAGNADGALTFGLIWLDYLRRREQRCHVEGLALFLPEGHEQTTCLRLRYLDPRSASFAVFVRSVDGFEEQIDPADRGNLHTRLEPCHSSVELRFHQSDLLAHLSNLPGVERIIAPEGSISLRVRGLEFARADGERLCFGIHQKRELTGSAHELDYVVGELARLRSPRARDRLHPLFTSMPEAWLESQVRAALESVNADLLPSPLYGQVPAVAGGERGLIDLLASDRRGRLAILELKATADPHLPFQALDYWMRVAWHLRRDEFSERGYFPGQPLSQAPPRLLLVAPALEFHPTTEIVLRFFSPAIPVERIGLGMDWKREVQVVFRAVGAGHPEMDEPGIA